MEREGHPEGNRTQDKEVTITPSTSPPPHWGEGSGFTGPVGGQHSPKGGGAAQGAGSFQRLWEDNDLRAAFSGAWWPHRPERTFSGWPLAPRSPGAAGRPSPGSE